MKSENTFFTARPRLASMAMNAGEKVEPTINIADPAHKAWNITLTPAAVAVIQRYYEEEELPLPKIIARWKKANADKTGA